MISFAYEISHCLSANHHPELRCVICTGVTLFAPVLHFFAPVLHLNCIALSHSESNNFFMCIIKVLMVGLSIFSPSCIFIPGRIPHRASVHTSCVCYDDWRARLWNNLRGYVFEPKSVESIPIHGIHFSLFVFVFVERRTDESLGKKTSSTYYDPIGSSEIHQGTGASFKF